MSKETPPLFGKTKLLEGQAVFKGYEEVIVQDIKLCTDNILFHKEKYYSPSEKKTYLAELPPGYEGEFGPGVKAFVKRRQEAEGRWQKGRIWMELGLQPNSVDHKRF